MIMTNTPSTDNAERIELLTKELQDREDEFKRKNNVLYDNLHLDAEVKLRMIKTILDPISDRIKTIKEELRLLGVEVGEVLSGDSPL